MNPRDLQSWAQVKAVVQPKKVHNWFELRKANGDHLCWCDTEEAVKRYVEESKLPQLNRYTGDILVYQLIGAFRPTYQVDFKFNKF